MRKTTRLSLTNKVLGATAATVAVALPIATGLLNASEDHRQASFETASIKPSKPGGQNVMIRISPGGRFVANGVAVKFLLEEAYNVKDSQLAGVPSWMESERYDIEAKPDDASGAALDKLPPDQRREAMMHMIQGLLADRFKLVLSHETKDLSIYALVVAKDGPKFHESTFKPPERGPDAPAMPPGRGGQPQGIWMNGRGNLNVTYADMAMFANVLSRTTGRVVIDKTGLTGKYDFTLHWTPEEGQGPMPPGGPAPSGLDVPGQPESNGPSLVTALQEQLGLRLESQKAPMDVLVIQHVEKPSEN